MKEKLIAQLLFYLLSKLPVDRLIALALQEFELFAEKVISKAKASAEASANKVDDAIVDAITELFHATFKLLGVPQLKSIMDFVLDFFESEKMYLRTCEIIRSIFHVPDNDMDDVKKSEIAAKLVDDLPEDKLRKIFCPNVAKPFTPYTPPGTGEH